jgi:hypothetical protein
MYEIDICSNKNRRIKLIKISFKKNVRKKHYHIKACILKNIYKLEKDNG